MSMKIFRSLSISHADQKLKREWFHFGGILLYFTKPCPSFIFNKFYSLHNDINIKKTLQILKNYKYLEDKI